MTKSKKCVRVGGWRIDLDQVPAVIEIFRSMLDRVDVLASPAHEVLKVQAMGADPISIRPAGEVDKRHFDGVGCTARAVESLRDELCKAVTQLDAAKCHYARVENASRRGLDRSR